MRRYLKHMIITGSLLPWALAACLMAQAPNAIPVPSPSPQQNPGVNPVPPQTPIQSQDQPPAIAPQATSAGMTIGSGDMLDIAFYGVPELEQKVRVTNGGDVYLALVGYVHLNGMPIEDAQALIEKRYIDGGYLKNPHVSILVTEYANGVSLLGEVQRPGIYPVLGQRRLYDLISAAGGLRDTAGRNVTILHRDDPANPAVVHLSSDPIESAQSNVEVHQGDTITIAKAPVVYVVGEVNHPSGFAMDSGQTLTVMRAIALAGGTTRIAALDHAKIIRKDTAGSPHEVPVELKKIMQARAEDVALQPDDVFFIPTSAAKNAATRTMESILQVVTGVGVRRF